MQQFRASRARKAHKVSASLVTSDIVLVATSGTSATTFSVVAASPRPSVTGLANYSNDNSTRTGRRHGPGDSDMELSKM